MFLKVFIVFCLGEISNVPLNFTAISVESGFARDTVEACVREILQVCLL